MNARWTWRGKRHAWIAVKLATSLDGWNYTPENAPRIRDAMREVVLSAILQLHEAGRLVGIKKAEYLSYFSGLLEESERIDRYVAGEDLAEPQFLLYNVQYLVTNGLRAVQCTRLDGNSAN